jgi:hypothetical protein
VVCAVNDGQVVFELQMKIVKLGMLAAEDIFFLLNATSQFVCSVHLPNAWAEHSETGLSAALPVPQISE